MSFPFDWSKYEEVPSEKPSFNWDQFESVEQEQPKQGLSFPKLGFGKKKVASESKVPKMKRTLGRTGKVVGSTLAGLPGDIVSGLGSASKWSAEKLGVEAKNPEALESIIDNPATSQSIQTEVEKLAPELAPRNDEEKEWEDNLALLTAFATPTPFGKSKAIDPKTATRLYKAGQRLGLSHKELTPLFQNEVKQSVFGKFAKKTRSLKKTLDITEGKLSDAYANVKNSASKLPQFSGAETSKMIDEIEKIKFGLEKTLKPSADKQAAINFLDGAIEKANNFGSSPEEVINFYQDINNAVNWKAIKGGKKVLAAAKKPLMDILERNHPGLWMDFTDTNALWSKMKGFESKIGLPRIEKFIEYGDGAALLAGLAFGNSTSDKIKDVAALMALRRVSTQLLTNPRWQNVHSKILNSIKNNSSKGGIVTLKLLKQKVKEEMPEAYEEIDWPSFYSSSAEEET